MAEKISSGKNHEEDASSDDDGSDNAQNPTLFVLSGVDTSLDEIVLEDCLTKVLSSYDISNDEINDGKEDEENFLPSIMVTLLETDYDEEAGVILFCIDRSLFVPGDDTENEASANAKADEDVLRRIREYVASEDAMNSDPVWIQDASKATIEIVQEEEVEKIMEEEAYESWSKHNQAKDGDNGNALPEIREEEKETEK